MKTLNVVHRTVYAYRWPVRFGEHQLMFRPRDSHDMRLVDTALTIEPAGGIRWMHDVFSNSIAVVRFEGESDRLAFESRMAIEHYGIERPDFPIRPFARTFPFSYPADVTPDLARTNERHYKDPDDRVGAWAKEFVSDGEVETIELLLAITRAVRERFAYEERKTPGTRDPVELLDIGHGTCRDFALFMMEAVRALGLAARFVTGYLCDPSIDDGGGALSGAGATHAWVQAFLPGAGWVEYDPTNGIIGGRNLIRVAVARDPSQAIPLQGTYFGAPDAFESMTVDVTVTAKGNSALAAAEFP